MAIEEVKKYRWVCDSCKDFIEIESSKPKYMMRPPDGWEIISIGPCGLTDYYRKEDRCPDCI